MSREPTRSSRTVFRGRILDLEVHEVDLGRGRRSSREIVRHGGAVGVLAQRPDGRFVLVRQYRKAVERDTLEIVAGGLEEGERPAACARREVREETGYEVDTLTALGSVWLAPGYSSERLHLFHARLKPARGEPRPDDDERIRTAVLGAGRMDAMLRSRGVADAKTVAAWARWKAVPR